MQHTLLLKSIPVVTAAGLLVYHQRTNLCTTVTAESPTINTIRSSFETPEKYLKAMFVNDIDGTAVQNLPPVTKPTLYSAQGIIEKLSQNANTVHRTDSNIISHYFTNQYNANNPIEDTFDIRLKPNTNTLQGSLIGVFDGHSGTHCSKYLREELLNFVEYSASTLPADERKVIDDELYNLSPSNENEFQFLKQHQMLPFTRAFLLADTAFLSRVSMSNKEVTKANTGACAVLCHLDEVENKTDRCMDRWISTAWVGDCRCVIGRCNDDGQWQCIPLTHDHQIDVNPKEKQRLLSEHPNEADVIKRNRVKGRLQPTRVFGDGHYKYMRFFNHWKNKYKYVDTSPWTPPYVTAKPDISCYKLEKNDKFMIVSTDGLFSDLNNEEIIAYVGDVLDGKEQNFKCENMSTLLIRKALLEAGKYFDGRLKTEELNLSSMLNLYDKMKRSVHDDITVIVIFFNDDCSVQSNVDKNHGKDIEIPETLKELFAVNKQSKL